MTRYFQIPGTLLARSSKTREYAYAAARLDEAGVPFAIVRCSPTAAGADRNARGAAPNSYAAGLIKVFPLVEITAAEVRALKALSREG